MQKIALPKHFTFEKGKELNQGKIIIEPFYPGYGITLGNSIRRILLSSLPGAAPVGVKIKGVNHEFTTLSSLKEDILEFILNLKKLRLKVFSDEVVKLELKVHGKKEIKASDIKANSLVEIINKDLILGSITDMSGSLEAEIHVSQGIGYVMIESRESKEKEIGFIDMDSIFSPVLSAGLSIESVRVGKMTNWEKLIINMTTDGTITPEQAFESAVEILINQYCAVIGTSAKAKEDKRKDKEDEDGINGKGGKEENEESHKLLNEDKSPSANTTEGKDAENKEAKTEEEEPEQPVKRKRGRPKKVN